MRSTSALVFLVAPCSGGIVCVPQQDLDHHEHQIVNGTQGEYMYTGFVDTVTVPGAAVVTVNSGYGLWENGMAKLGGKTVGDPVATAVQTQLKERLGVVFPELAQATETEIASVFAADAVTGAAAGAAAGFLIAGGIALLADYTAHWEDNYYLAKNAQISVQELGDAYRDLVRAFTLLPHPITRLADSLDTPTLCRWHDAATSMTQKILDAQKQLRDQQTTYEDCWFLDCGSPVPAKTMVDMQHLEGKAERLNEDFTFFLNCYPHCDHAAMSSNWNSMIDDAFHICKGVHKVTCDFDDEDTQAFCHSLERHPCTRWRDSPPPMLMLASAPETAVPVPPETPESTAVMLEAADSCGREQHSLNDLKQLVRCTQARFTTQESDWVNQKRRLLLLCHVACGVWMVSCLAMIFRNEKICCYQDPPAVPGYSRVRDADGDADADSMCHGASKKVAIYWAPMLMSLSMFAVGIAAASYWSLLANTVMVRETALWLSTVEEDLDDLDMFVANPHNMTVTNFSILANDISTALVTAIQSQLPSPLPAVHV